MDVDEDGVPIPAVPRPKKTLSRRHLAFLSPRLGVLNNIPQTVSRLPKGRPDPSQDPSLTFAYASQVPFELRVEIFRAFIVCVHNHVVTDLRVKALTDRSDSVAAYCSNDEQNQ